MNVMIKFQWNSTNLTFHSPGNDKQYTANTQVGQQDVDPNVRGHGFEEGEKPTVGAVWSTVKDADPRVQEWLREINHFLSHKGDRKGSYSQICSLRIRGKKDKKYIYYIAVVSFKRRKD